MSDVTRTEIASVLDGVFEMPRRGSELAYLARSRGARSAIVHDLQRLPDRPFTHLRELWEVLPEIPIGE